MAIWVECEGIYNLLVDRCNIVGTGELHPEPPAGDEVDNFRNGIVVDVKDEEDRCDVRLVVKDTEIRDVMEHGILLHSSHESLIDTKLDPGKFPELPENGLHDIDIHGCLNGSAIRVNAGSAQTTKISVLNSNLYNNKYGGIHVEGHAHWGELIKPPQGSPYVVYHNTNGTSRLLFMGNNIYDEIPSGSIDGCAGIYLETRALDDAEPLAASIIEAAMGMNRIHHLKGRGLVAVSNDQIYHRTNLIRVESANDRIYHNLSDGVLIDDMMESNGKIDVFLRYMTSCHNSGIGLCFDDTGPNHNVNAVNSIFFHQLTDVNENYTGTISYCDWDEGFQGGGGGYGVGNIDLIPEFADDEYHLQWGAAQSPCIDAGFDNADPSVHHDMEHDDRIIDVKPDTDDDTDMGADEHDPN
jgi:hypothetical protein